jgi:hypothetical protein
VLIGYGHSIYNKTFEEGYELFEQRVKAHYGGQNMFSQQLFSKNCLTFNFHQANIKKAFHKLYSK